MGIPYLHLVIGAITDCNGYPYLHLVIGAITDCNGYTAYLHLVIGAITDCNGYPPISTLLWEITLTIKNHLDDLITVDENQTQTFSIGTPVISWGIYKSRSVFHC